MDDDFKDVLSIFSDEPKKTEKPDEEEEKPVEEEKPEASPAAASGGFKKPMPGKGFQRPTPGGKFPRPAVPGTPPAPAAKAVPTSPAASHTSPAQHNPPVPPPAVVAASPILAFPQEKAGSPLNSFLLIAVAILCLISLLISAGTLAKVSSMRTEMKLLNENMKEVRISADRSWQIKCGIYVPVPNQRPQEYMIKYEEKNGQLIKKEMITRPIE